MPKPDDYRRVRTGDWQLFVFTDQWNANIQSQVLERVGAQAPARHPQTLELSSVVGTEVKVFYLKVFHRSTLLAAAKNLLRWRGALRFWLQGLALSAAGFNVPLTIAVGAERGWGLIKREFVLTERIEGAPVPLFLRNRLGDIAGKLTGKRRAIRELAEVVSRFHQEGFVHGDMVASNIFLSETGAGRAKFYFMDNDRTRRYPHWLAQTLWKRNLIQLNRLPLAGISLQDRMRFLHAYSNVARLSLAERRFARWLELKTRLRRQECDGADPTGSFRKLMQWAPEISPVRNVR